MSVDLQGDAVVFVLDANHTMGTRLSHAKDAVLTSIDAALEVGLVVLRVGATHHHLSQNIDVADEAGIAEFFRRCSGGLHLHDYDCGSGDVPLKNLVEFPLDRPTSATICAMRSIQCTINDTLSPTVRGNVCDGLMLAADTLYRRTGGRKYKRRRIVVITDAEHEVVGVDWEQMQCVLDGLKEMEVELIIVGIGFHAMMDEHGSLARGRIKRENEKLLTSIAVEVGGCFLPAPADANLTDIIRTKLTEGRQRDSLQVVVIDSDDDDVEEEGKPAALPANNRQQSRRRKRKQPTSSDIINVDSTDTFNDDVALARRLQAAERASASRRREATSMEDVLSSLDKCQRDALQAVEAQARLRHDAALPKVRKRVVSLGYKSEDLDRCLTYIRDDAPIVIHLNEQCLSFLAKPEETHYRNLFEVNASGGSTSTSMRREWERKMFGRHYDRASPFQRVKYGCVNLTGDIEGVGAARSYGPFFLTLKPSVRHRCTFFNMDTASFGASSFLSGSTAKDVLATARNYCHILEKYNDNELKSVLGLSRVGGGKSKCMAYKEMQVHGPVCLATDIESLSVPGRKDDASPELLAMVEALQKKAKCSILWQGDLLGYDNRKSAPGAGLMPGFPLASLMPGFGGHLSAPASRTVPFSGAGHTLGGHK